MEKKKFFLHIVTLGEGLGFSTLVFRRVESSGSQQSVKTKGKDIMREGQPSLSSKEVLFSLSSVGLGVKRMRYLAQIATSFLYKYNFVMAWSSRKRNLAFTICAVS